jgi:hypothetical protein
MGKAGKKITKKPALRAGLKTASHVPEATEANKKMLIQALAKGLAPGCAAALIGVGRSTAYAWKRDDSEFAAQWDLAVQSSLDRLEFRSESQRAFWPPVVSGAPEPLRQVQERRSQRASPRQGLLFWRCSGPAPHPGACAARAAFRWHKGQPRP